MNEKDKKELLEEFKKSDGTKHLDMWDYTCQQQVLWEDILTQMQNIARDQGVDKELDKRMEEDMKDRS